MSPALSGGAPHPCFSRLCIPSWERGISPAVLCSRPLFREPLRGCLTLLATVPFAWPPTVQSVDPVWPLHGPPGISGPAAAPPARACPATARAAPGSSGRATAPGSATRRAFPTRVTWRGRAGLPAGPQSPVPPGAAHPPAGWGTRGPPLSSI